MTVYIKTFGIISLFLIVIKLEAQVKTKIITDALKSNIQVAPFYESKTINLLPPTDFYNLSISDNNLEMGGYRFATNLKVNIDFMKQAEENLNANILIYCLNISANTALNISIEFGEFELSSNAILSINSENEFTDSITYIENNKPKRWHSRVYQGNKLTIKLKVPINEINRNHLLISNVNFGYKKFGADFGNPGASASCNINVACPEGIGWEQESNSIVLLVLNGQSLCTGSLIMNTCNINIPYVLSAWHCFDETVAPNLVAQFKYLSSTCPVNTIGTDIQFNGLTMKSSYPYEDFSLLQLNQTPSSNSGLFYSGWSRNINNISSTTILHHPKGDLMKISKDNSAPIAATVPWASPIGQISLNGWRLDLDYGIVEGGSSGAPYYNQNHQIIGHHTFRPDNLPVCSNTRTVGGRLDHAWVGGGSNSTRLRNWLDPAGTNQTATNTTSITSLPSQISSPPSNFTNFNTSGIHIFCKNQTSTISIDLVQYPGLNNFIWGSLPAGWIKLSGGTGSYYITIKSPNSSSPPSFTLTVSANSICGYQTSVGHFIAMSNCTSFLISPNPSDGFFLVEEIDNLTGEKLKEINIKKVEIFSNTGIVKFSQKYLNSILGTSLKISTHSFPEGIYLLKIYDDIELKNYSIIIKH